MADTEYLLRRDRLKSEAEQSRTSTVPPPLEALCRELNALTDDDPTETSLITVQKIEAELCLYKPECLLFPTYLRLKSKLYRFDQDRRDSWQADLKRLAPDGHTINDAPVFRQRLRQLTFELSEEAESFNRLSRERSRVLCNLTVTGIVMLVVLLVLGWLAFSRPLGDPGTFTHWLLVTCLAGAIGAAASSMDSIRKEKQRDDYQTTLQWQMGSRAMLGLIYALLVYSAVFSKIVPLAIPAEIEPQRALFLALGFVAGFSDKLFGQTVSQFITKSSTPAAKGKGAKPPAP